MALITDEFIAQLTVSERIDLVTRIWDSIPDSSETPPDWHRAEIEQRLASASVDPDAGMDWTEFKELLLKRA